MSIEDVVLEPESHPFSRASFQFELSQEKRKLQTVRFLDDSPAQTVRLLPEGSLQILVSAQDFSGKMSKTKLGSVSIPMNIVLDGRPGKHTQWVTLFDDENDDVYDGQMDLNDEEPPKILVTFTVGAPARHESLPRQEEAEAALPVLFSAAKFSKARESDLVLLDAKTTGLKDMLLQELQDTPAVIEHEECTDITIERTLLQKINEMDQELSDGEIQIRPMTRD